MRRVAFAFILFWIAGIALGVSAASPLTALALAATAGGLCRVQQWGTARAAAAIILVLTGYAYVSFGHSDVAACSLAMPIRARVLEREIEVQRVRYVVEYGRLCLLAVSAERFPVYSVGDTLEISGTARPVSDVAERTAGYAAYLVRRGIGGVVERPSLALVSSGGYLHGRVYAQVQERILAVLPEPDASLVAALLLGEQGTVPTSLQNVYRVTGTSHILAISGLQISLFAGMVVALLSLLPLSPVVRAVATLFLLWLYVWFIGMPVSAVRALFFWTFALFSMRLGVLVPLASVVLLTAAVMISYHPLVLLDIGFQLSVAAVAGIGLALFIALPSLHGGGIMHWVAGLLLASIGATLATLPIVAYHFGTMSLIGVMVNLFVVPPQPVLLVLGLLVLIFSFVAAPVGLFVGFLLHLVLAGMNEVVRLGSLIPGVWFTDLSWPAWLVAAYYTVLASAAYGIMRWQGRSWREVWQ